MGGLFQKRVLGRPSPTSLEPGRSYLTENAAELERRTKRQCTEFDIPLAMDEGPGCAPPAAHHPPGDGSHPHIAGDAAAGPACPSLLPPLRHRRCSENLAGRSSSDSLHEHAAWQ